MDIALVPHVDDNDYEVDHSTPDDAGNNSQIVISTEHRNKAEEVMNRRVVISTKKNYACYITHSRSHSLSVRRSHSRSHS